MYKGTCQDHNHNVIICHTPVTESSVLFALTASLRFIVSSVNCLYAVVFVLSWYQIYTS